MEFKVPKYFFGEEKPNLNPINDDEEEEELEMPMSDDEKTVIEEDEVEQNDWNIQSVQGMSMTTNQIAQCQRNHKEFCFVVKPAPGSRKLNIVGFQQQYEIEQMIFVSNNHVLMRFRGGKTVTLLSNGCIVHQDKRVKRYLEENSKIVGESQISLSKKIVLLEQAYGEELEKFRHVALQFNSLGKAQVVAIFDQYRDQIQKHLELYLKV